MCRIITSSRMSMMHVTHINHTIQRPMLVDAVMCMSHIWMNHVTHVNTSLNIRSKETRSRAGICTLPVWISHVTFVHRSCHTRTIDPLCYVLQRACHAYSWGMSHMNKLWHTWSKKTSFSMLWYECIIHQNEATGPNVNVRDDYFTCVIWLILMPETKENHMPEKISKRMSNRHTSLSRVSSKKAHVNTAASSANECRNRKFELNLCVSRTHTYESSTSWHRYQQRERVLEQNIPTQSVFESRTHAYESGTCWYATSSSKECPKRMFRLNLCLRICVHAVCVCARACVCVAVCAVYISACVYECVCVCVCLHTNC